MSDTTRNSSIHNNKTTPTNNRSSEKSRSSKAVSFCVVGDQGNYKKSNNIDETTASLRGERKDKRHREEISMDHHHHHVHVIPENWGKEHLLKEWKDYTSFDAFFAPHSLIVTARDALIAEARKAKSHRSTTSSSQYLLIN